MYKISIYQPYSINIYITEDLRANEIIRHGRTLFEVNLTIKMKLLKLGPRNRSQRSLEKFKDFNESREQFKIVGLI